MPVKITARPALSAKSMPSETFPLQTAKNMAPPLAANVTAVSSFAASLLFVKPTLLQLLDFDRSSALLNDSYASKNASLSFGSTINVFFVVRMISLQMDVLIFQNSMHFAMTP